MRFPPAPGSTGTNGTPTSACASCINSSLGPSSAAVCARRANENTRSHGHPARGYQACARRGGLAPSKGLKTYVCATAQHRELLDQALTLFALKPDFDLDLMRPGQSPDAVAKRIFSSLGPLLARLKPDMVVVQGDTTTAASAALCAYERGIPVAHVEAGLRSFDLNDPYPEERNRIVIDLLASLLFAPTPAARMNLVRERLLGRTVITTGNTVVDALRSYRPPHERVQASRRQGGPRHAA